MRVSSKSPVAGPSRAAAADAFFVSPRIVRTNLGQALILDAP